MANKLQLEAILKLVDVQINPAVFRRISQAVANLPASVKGFSQGINAANTSAGTLNNTLGQTGSQISVAEKGAKLFLQRMAQFAILLPTFATLNKIIQGSVSFLFDFDSALRDIIRADVTGLSDQMEQVGDAALKTARDLGESSLKVLEFTKTFIQAGFTIEESQDKARAAILATQVSTLNAAEAVEIFIAADKQFQAEGKNSAAVLDKLAKVEDVAAANAVDIADAFRTGGNSLAEFSKSIDDSIGLIAALREQTRKSGSEIGTFLKTIQTRIFAAGEARDAVEGLGIAIENLDGSLRPTKDVLNDLKTAFDGMTESQAASAAKAIAGVRQFESLIATLNSIDRANELARESAAAAGAAEEKRTITDAKLERQLGKLVAAGETLAEALGGAGLEDALVGALKVATKLVDTFSSAVNIIDSLGGSIAPLLALGGITLGRGIFGGGKGGGAGGGQQQSINPLTGAPNIQASVAPFKDQMAQLTNILKSSTGYLGVYGKAVLTSSTITSQHGAQVNANTAALAQFKASIQSSIATIKASEAASIKNVQGITQSTAGIVAFTLAASTLPGIFGALEEKLRSTGSTFGDVAAEATSSLGAGASLAAQFAIAGVPAAAVAFAFGTLQDVTLDLITAFEDNNKALEETAKLKKGSGDISRARSKLGGIGADASEVGEALLDSLIRNIQGQDPGKELAKGISKAFIEFQNGTEAARAGLKEANIGEALLGDINTLKQFINTQEEAIRARAEEIGTLEQADTLFQLLNDSSTQAGEAFNALALTIGAGVDDVNLFNHGIRTLSFEEFGEAQEVLDLADSLRTLNLELQAAQLGPEGLSDAVVNMADGLLRSEREFESTSLSIQESIANLFTNLPDFGQIGQNPDGPGVAEFFNIVNNASKDLDPESIKQFTEFIRDLPPTQRKAAEEIEKLLKKQLESEVAIQKERNALQEEVLKRQKDLNDAEAKAAMNAFEATRLFNAELEKFGAGVSTDVLSAFQNLSIGDVDSILAGASDLPDALQQLVLNSFDPVSEAANDLGAVIIDSQAELDILSKKLEKVNEKLADEANAADKASLISEKREIELDIEKNKQQELIEATQAKVKLLGAEKKAAQEAAEAEKKRIERLEKLTDASRAFDKELRDIQKSFDEFSKEKIGDLLEDEADARNELKEAQKETLSATEDLAKAYEALVQAQFDFNDAIAESRVESNLLARDIEVLTGGISTFDGQLANLNNAFNEVLDDANITLGKRIELERQLAEETISFLEQARQEITQAGISVFGQSGAENQDLAQGIAGLQFVAEQLGGSFESFQSLSDQDFSEISQSLLNLPVEFRQQILDALSALPGSVNIGGFSADQLEQAIGQVGAGVAPEAGLPSIEELNGQQVEQLQKLQDLSLQDAQLQIEQLIKAQEQVALAEQQLEAAKIQEQRASENLQLVAEEVLYQSAILEQANSERKELLAQVIAADDRNSLAQIEREAELFAEQNAAFAEVGQEIVKGISSAISSRLAVIDAQNEINGATGYIPNFAGGNLKPSEAAGVLRAARREKRQMPAGARLAVANTHEAIVPMYGGHVPNYASGNTSPIAAGIESIRGINEAVLAAISQSISQALVNSRSEDSSTGLLSEISTTLLDIQGELQTIAESNTLIQSNTSQSSTTGTTTTTASASQVNISLETSQNNTVTVTGLESLIDNIRQAVRDAALEQVEAQLTPLLGELTSIFQVLRERGLLSSISQPG